MAIYNGGLSIKNVSIGTTTGSGNAITSLSADGNVITPNKGSTFLTAQDISGKANKSEIEASVTTDSLTAGSINAKNGSSSIGSNDTKFDSLFVSHINNRTADRFAYVGDDGVMEIGRYLDFHKDGTLSNANGDYTCRVEVTDDNKLKVGEGIYGAVFN